VKKKEINGVDVKKNEIVKAEAELVTIDVDAIPEIVTSSIKSISQLEKKVRDAESSAGEAMEFVAEQMDCYVEKGKWIFKRRTGNTKDIIEDTQKGLQELAKAQHVSVEALQMSFDFQRKLAETSKYLFQLGCANMVANRVAVRAIELKLSGAGKEEISELAKQEMLAVVKQLKAQEDILKKQEFLHSKVKSHENILNFQKDKDEEHDALLKRQMDVDALHDQELEKQAQIDLRHDQELHLLTERCDKIDEVLRSLKAFGSNGTGSLRKLILASFVFSVLAFMGVVVLFALMFF